MFHLVLCCDCLFPFACRVWNGVSIALDPMGICIIVCKSMFLSIQTGSRERWSRISRQIGESLQFVNNTADGEMGEVAVSQRNYSCDSADQFGVFFYTTAYNF